MPKILLVDDDIQLGLKLQEWFLTKSVNLEIVTSGEDALQALEYFDFDVILLDWNLPGMSGLDVCTAYRARQGRSFIIFLTGQGDIENKEKALFAGGDDYIVKPFDVREVYARISSVMRRSLVIADKLLTVQDVTLDPESRQVSVGDKKVQLTVKEAAMLEYMMRRPDQPFTAERLLTAVWPSETETSIDSVRSWMRLLRQKLASIGKLEFIKTVVGTGYVVESTDSIS
ncbi:MAG: response regulator transcription factor [Cyanobacteria bacterium SZAS TMP-1]|nr:response regulator transcription factor [Cyanobacteria bacterium SZAS TMP-1]